jgi:hypothetical protein
MAQDRDWRQALVNMLMNLQVMAPQILLVLVSFVILFNKNVFF